MIAFFSWYLVISLIGWLAFPLAYRLLPALADRGYSLSRVFGLLLSGYIFWLLTNFGVTRNDAAGILLALALTAGLAVWAAARNTGLPGVASEMRAWLQENTRLVVTLELLFLLAFAAWSLVRAANPEAIGTEKPMELAFINAILRSPAFPPNDPWLSGYAISYYYFGYVLTAMLAKLTGTSGSVAFNLMIALLFALSASGSYGIVYNLLARFRAHSGGKVSLSQPLFGPLFLLLVSNLEGFLEVLHSRGLFWSFNPDGSAVSAFWSWLDLKELTQPPPLPLDWVPQRFWWWWRASRVVQDYDLVGNFREVIDEFPFFSYLLGDLHPHVLAMPFALLAIGLALNLYLGRSKGQIRLPGFELHLGWSELVLAAVVLGGLAFLNTWDFPIYVGLFSAAYVLSQVREFGWDWERLLEFIVLGVLLGLAGGLAYLPFYAGFSSQAGGLLPNLINPTRGAHLWIMFGILFLPAIDFLVYLTRRERTGVSWKMGFGLAFLVVAVLWVFSILLGLLAASSPEAQAFLSSQGNLSLSDFLARATGRRLSYIAGLLTLVALGGVALSVLIPLSRTRSEKNEEQTPASIFTLLLLLFGALLVLAPEFVYLRDQFGTRMNTVFKFYYQAWILWSLVAATSVSVLLTTLRGRFGLVFRVGLAFVLLAGLTYPALSLVAKTNNFNPTFGWSLDSAAYFFRENPDEGLAIRWLQSAEQGVVAEAIGGSYTGFARVSTNTGLQSVLGWPGHEGQWRGGYTEQGSRREDIERLYATPDWNEARAIIERYNIRYVYVGQLERSVYRVNEIKFQRFLTEVFRQGDVVIYAVPDTASH